MKDGVAMPIASTLPHTLQFYPVITPHLISGQDNVKPFTLN